jgi:pSer/pThr/pTyr-binding forkhead associated (FHA) protein
VFQLWDEQRQMAHHLTGLIKEIGRGDECDVAIPDDVSLSRVHARLDRQAEHWVLMDLDSTNGTFVNGERIREVRLQPGDLIELGDTRLRFLPLLAASQPAQKRTTLVNVRPAEEGETKAGKGLFSRVKTVLKKK